MPTISLFFNIKILMFWNDHAPPHFHAAFVGHDEDTIIAIQTLEGIAPGSLKRRALGLVLDWRSCIATSFSPIGNLRVTASLSTRSRRWSR